MDTVADTSEEQLINIEETTTTSDDLDYVSTRSCKHCKNCAFCCYNVLYRYNMLSGAYSTLGLAYKFLLTLSISQVSCERSFSTLKNIKTRLRSTLNQEHLEAFMLMSIEKDILNGINNEDVIYMVAQKSKLLQENLLL